MRIRTATKEDLSQVHAIESITEGQNAANYNTIKSRFEMFPDGFFVAENYGKIYGYAQSCMWEGINNLGFNEFSKIKGFSDYHNSSNNCMYLIFVGVEVNKRHQGIGTNLVNTVINEAKYRNLEEVELVSKDKLVQKFYQESLGFNYKNEMPNWLPKSKHHLMNMEL